MAARAWSLWIAVCVANGCAVQRIIAVESIDSGTLDAASVGEDGSPGTEAGSDANRDSSECTNPVFVTSSRFGIWIGDAGYNVFNNEWNVDAGPGLQTLYVCSQRSWYVVSDQQDDAGTVKTYPNVQMNFNEVPMRSFHSVTSTFAETSPQVGIYEDVYDVWLNGVATPGSAQILIWVQNNNRVPEGSQVTTTTLGGRPYAVWKTSDNSHFVLLSTVPFTSGTVDLLEIFNWVVAQGWLPAASTLGQIDFGVEIVSTGAASATFVFSDFSISTD